MIHNQRGGVPITNVVNLFAGDASLRFEHGAKTQR
jgi:hypothetical protein